MATTRIICFILLMAAVTVVKASEDNNDARSKRDIAFFKNLLMGKLFRSEEVPFAGPEKNYRLFKIPGFKNVLVKAVPKVNVVVPPPAEELKIEDVHPSIGLVSSFLGTKTLDETLSALEGMKAMLQSGVLSAREETGYSTYRVPLSPYSTETLEVIDLDGVRPDCKYPFLKHPVPIPYTSIGNQHSFVKVPVPDLPYPAKYSYKQIHGNGMTTYTSNDDKNVIVTESKYPAPLPEYLNNRFKNILALGFRPAAVDTNDNYYKYLNRDGSVSIFSGSGVVEKGNSQDSMNLFDSHHLANVGQSFNNDYSYKTLHKDGSVSSYSSGLGVVEQGKNENLLLSSNPYIHKPVGHIHAPSKLRVASPLPVPNIPNDYSYQHIHKDGSVSTYSGSGVVEDGKRPLLPIPPFIHKPTPVLHIYDSPKDIVIPSVPVAPLPNDYSYKHINQDGSVSTYSGSGVTEEVKRPPVPIHPFIHKPIPMLHIHNPPKEIVVPSLPVAPVSNDYSYKHIHRDGTVSTYSGSGITEQSQKLPLAIHPLNTKPLPVANFPDPPRLIVAPTLPIKPILVANDYPYNNLHKNVSVTNFSGPRVLKESKIQKLPMSGHPIHIASPVINIHELPKVKIPRNPHESSFVTNDYSYKHVHQDGSVTTYSGQGNIVEKPVVPIGTFEASLGPVYEAPHIIESSFIPTKVSAMPTDYSYNHLHNDGTVTTYSGEGVVEKIKERPAVIVEEIRNPAPLPSFLANRIENLAATAYKVDPPLAVVKETVYGPPIPVYQEPHPILLEHSSFIPQSSNPPFNEEVIVDVNAHNSEIPSRHFYESGYQDGTSIVQLGSGLAEEINKNSNVKIIEDTEGKHHSNTADVILTNPSPIEKVFNSQDFRNNTQILIDSSQAGEYSFTTVHKDGFTSTYSGSEAKPHNKLSEHTKAPSTSRRIIKKIVRRPSKISQESTNKNINDHVSSQQIVLTKVDGSKRTGQANILVKEKNTFNRKTESSASTFAVGDEYSTIPGSTFRSMVPEVPVAEFSYKQATDDGFYIDNNGAVDFKSETSSNHKDTLDRTNQHIYTTDSTLTSSAVSFNANPIVVLPDEHVFSYKQDKAGSSITVLSNNINKVAVVEENRTEKLETYRGDIPGASY